MKTMKYFLWVCVLGLMAAPVYAAKSIGKAASVSGRVLIRNEGNQGVSKIRPLKTAGKIYEGDIINTGSTSQAKLLFNDRSLVDLGPSTLFKVKEYKIKKDGRKVDIAMDYGRARVSVNKKLKRKSRFKVRTKTATMGVRGTEFMMISGIDSFPVGKEGREAQTEANSKPTTQAGKKTKAGTKNARSTRSQLGGRGKTEIMVFEGTVEVEAKVQEKSTSSGSNKSKKTAKVKRFKLQQGSRLTMKADAAQSPGELGGDGRGLASINQEAKIEKVSVAEMKVVKDAVIVQDQTFDQAIDMNAVGDGEGPTGEQTMADFHHSIESQGDIGVGLDGPVQGLPGVPHGPGGIQGIPNIQGRPINVNVRFIPGS